MSPKDFHVKSQSKILAHFLIEPATKLLFQILIKKIFDSQKIAFASSIYTESDDCLHKSLPQYKFIAIKSLILKIWQSSVIVSLSFVSLLCLFEWKWEGNLDLEKGQNYFWGVSVKKKLRWILFGSLAMCLLTNFC